MEGIKRKVEFHPIVLRNMSATSDLDAHLERLSQRVGRASLVTIQHPAELRAFQGSTWSELSAAASKHDLRIVSRDGGNQLDFMRLAKA